MVSADILDCVNAVVGGWGGNNLFMRGSFAVRDLAPKALRGSPVPVIGCDYVFLGPKCSWRESSQEKKLKG